MIICYYKYNIYFASANRNASPESGWNGKTMLKGLKIRLELTAVMKLHNTRQVMMHTLTWDLPLSSLQLAHSWRPLSFIFGSKSLENICEVSAC